RCVMYSLDLDPYVNALKAGEFHIVKAAIANGCTRLQAAGADFVVLCSNTAHIGTDNVVRSLGAVTPLLHMADCTAAAIKKLGLTKCGFIGTAFAMSRGDIMLDRLRLHGLDVVVPAEQSARDKVWHIIEHELSHNKQTAESRTYVKS